MRDQARRSLRLFLALAKNLADAEGDTASNQYLMADIGCHLLCFRIHATEAREYKVPANQAYFKYPRSIRAMMVSGVPKR